MSDKPKITIIGSGLAGPLLAISLHQRGFAVEIYERRPDMRKVHISAGRSINLALSTRGIHALREAGIWSEIEKIIIPMKGRMMHSVAGELTFQPYGKDESEVINSVSRAELNIVLMNAAEANGIEIHFDERCTGMDLRSGTVALRNEESGQSSTIATDLVIATDGSGSAIRSEFLHMPRFNFSQEYLDYGYKELTIPPVRGREHAMELNALHIWPRGAFMLIALPNVDGTYGCILFLPYEGENSFAQLRTNVDVEGFFQQHFPDIVPLMPKLAENYFANPVGSMVTVKCSPWHYGSRAVLLGDSAHAIVPFFGQGLNCSFEDCTYLLELVDLYGTDWDLIFTKFQGARKKNTDAIADLAVENFVEMRDRVADPRFLFRKKTELALEARFPDYFVPKYAMVTFHRIPYSVAASRGLVQDRILAELCDSVHSVDEINWQRAGELIHSQLTPFKEA